MEKIIANATEVAAADSFWWKTVDKWLDSNARCTTNVAKPDIRVWVPSCGNGESAYAIAMHLLARIPATNHNGMKVFATDTAATILSVRDGAYQEHGKLQLPEVYRGRYWDIKGTKLELDRAFRKKIVFSVLDVLRDPPFNEIDLIYAGSLLKSLDPAARTVALRKFQFSLRAGGTLWVSDHSEFADEIGQLFNVIDAPSNLYRGVPLQAARPVRPVVHSHIGTDVSVMHSTLRTTLRLSPEEALHLKLANLHQRHTILLNRNFQVVHIGQGARRFLRVSPGQPSANIFSLIDPALQTKLRALLFKVPVGPGVVDSRYHGYLYDEWVKTIAMSARVVIADHHEYILLSFEAIDVSMDVDDGADSIDTVNGQLELEVARLEYLLQDAAANTGKALLELKDSNEEAQAVNEELRAVSDELMFINEKLNEINDDLSARNWELARASDEIRQFVDATPIAMVVLDAALCIKRYTRAICSIFSLRDGDIGRPLFDIRHCLSWSTYEDDVRGVASTSKAIERKLTSTDARRFIVQISPVSADTGQRQRVTITFTDVTRLSTADYSETQ